MKITFFDIDSIGNDLDLTPITSLGECEIYKSTTPEELLTRAAETEVAVINKIKITQEVLNCAPNLKLICVAATGFDNIDLIACRKHQVAVTNVPAYSTNSVALVTVATVLSLMTKLSIYSEFVKSGEYSKLGLPNRLTPQFNDLCGKTWGIIGYGNIGKKVGEIAAAFGCKVIYNKNTPCDDRNFRSVDDLCRESDIITLHCPLNSGTKHLINETRLNSMKPTAVLVNEARGAVCDEAAVAMALKNGRIGAFGCDVYEKEPLAIDHPYNEIMNFGNVCLTPHMAWSSFEARTKVIYEMSENIKAFSIGGQRNRVDL